MKKMFLSFLFLIVLSVSSVFAQNPTCEILLKNDALISAREYQFDLFIKRTGETSFSYSGASQFVLTFNSAGIGGSGLTYSMVPGTSELNVGQAIPSNKFSISGTQLRIAANAANLGSATLVSNVGNGTRIGRLKLTSATDFTGASANLTWLMNGAIRTKIFGTVDGLAGIEYTNSAGTTNNPSGTVTYSVDLTNAPLPIELSSFIASAQGRNIELKWATATEVNTSLFQIERKEIKENSTESSWKKVGEIKASGNSNSPKEYNFTDKKLNSGKFSYRLKMVDIDGTYEFSDAVEAEIDLPKEYGISQNYPNPFNPTTRIDYQLPNDSKVILELFSITGEKVATLLEGEITAGYYNYQLSTSSFGLSSGIYLYRIVAGDFVSVKKMVVLK
ncbi:MAG: T9SS type A sorting domain-containing protein [Ignavibacteriaceae bacterium]